MAGGGGCSQARLATLESEGEFFLTFNPGLRLEDSPAPWAKVCRPYRTSECAGAALDWDDSSWEHFNRWAAAEGGAGSLGR
jgi:hypothetical protein